jgi:hypothetical protein
MGQSKKVSNALNLQRRVLPVQEKAISAMIEASNEIEEITSWICDTAISLGMSSRNINVYNAQHFLSSVVRDTQEWQGKSAELGYSSVSIALKALSQYKDRVAPVDINQLPDVFHKVPGVWLTGKPKTKVDKGFPPLRIKDAERQWRGMLPWLLETWELSESADNRDEVRDSLIKDYLTMHHEEFVRQCYIYINDLDVPDLEEELSEIASLPMSDWDAQIALSNIGRPSYGAGGKLEDVD